MIRTVKGSGVNRQKMLIIYFYLNDHFESKRRTLKKRAVSPALNLRVFADFDKFVERVFVMNGDIRENFSIQFNISFFQAADKSVISSAAVSCGDTYSCDPEFSEVTFFDTSVTESVSEGSVEGFFS